MAKRLLENQGNLLDSFRSSVTHFIRLTSLSQNVNAIQSNH
jgi:hypothetical protein